MAPRRRDGKSILPLLMGRLADQDSGRELYFEHHEGGFVQAVRFGLWKAVRRGLAGDVELYNLGDDPAESKNVAAENPQVVARAVKILDGSRSPSPDWPVPGE